MKNQGQPSEEKMLDERIRTLLGKGSGDYSPEDWQSVRENLRLSLLYPGRHVVFRDRWQGRGDNLRLVERRVLFDSPNADEARTRFQQELEATPLEEQPNLGLTFVEATRSQRRGDRPARVQWAGCVKPAPRPAP
jgi:hypothetical protein